MKLFITLCAIFYLSGSIANENTLDEQVVQEVSQGEVLQEALPKETSQVISQEVSQNEVLQEVSTEEASKVILQEVSQGEVSQNEVLQEVSTEEASKVISQEVSEGEVSQNAVFPEETSQGEVLQAKEDLQKSEALLDNSTRHAFALRCTTALFEFNNIQNAIDEFMRIFKEIRGSKTEINDLHHDIMTWVFMVPENESLKIDQIKREFDSFAKNLKLTFTNQLEMSGNSDVDNDKLDEIISSYQDSDWTPTKLHTHLDGFTQTKRKIKLMKLLQSAKGLFIDRRTDKQQLLSDNYNQKVGIISMDLNTDISSPYIRQVIRLLKAQNVKKSGALKYYIEDTPANIPEVNIYLEGKKIRSFEVREKEYVLLKDGAGKVIVIDAETHDQIITDSFSGIEFAVVAVVDNNFYIIDALKGVIISSPIENIMKSKNFIKWDTVGYFQNEGNVTHNSVTVSETYIYFVTFSGILYCCDTISKTVTKISTIPLDDYYASLVVVNNILYIHAYSQFYQYDGNSVTEITTPISKLHSGIFEMGNNVCRVGGSTRVVFPDPVDCYNPEDKTWRNVSYINEFRSDPGVVTTQFGTYIFGGFAWSEEDVGDLGHWRNSAEMFNFNKQLMSNDSYWSYIRSPLENEPRWVQAISFFF